MQSDKIKRILEENKELFEALESYDKTHKLPIGRARIDITLNKKTIKRLIEEKSNTGKPVSRIIEDSLRSFFSKDSR